MCAEMYHRADFIQSDPVQFPHRYTLKQGNNVMVQMYGVVMSLPHGRVLEIRFLPD